MVKAVLEDVKTWYNEIGETPRVYMHAQLHAETFYEKFSFKRVGDPFIECHIDHVKMERYL